MDLHSINQHKVNFDAICQIIKSDDGLDTTLRYAMANQNNVKLFHHKYIG